MPNPDHFRVLNQGVRTWNEWRRQYANLETIADLRNANLRNAHLSGIDLNVADLRGANLSGADLSQARLAEAQLGGANLTGANLAWAEMIEADLSDADLTRACLFNANLNDANLRGATLTGCRVYGVSAWHLKNIEQAHQSDLVITPAGEPTITVDNLEVAQFVYLLLNNRRIREAIDTITSRVVLILGRFTEERKAVLDALRERIRQLDYLPVLFDFDPAFHQSRMETVVTLAHLARFVIADITDARTILQELQGIVPARPSLPVQPILLTGQNEPGMFDFFRLYPWFLPTVYYESPEFLLTVIGERVIEPAEKKARELARRLEEVRGT